MSQHDHGDHHEHPPEERPGYYDRMETAIEELLIERHLIGPDEIRRQIEVLELSDAGAWRKGRRAGLG